MSINCSCSKSQSSVYLRTYCKSTHCKNLRSHTNHHVPLHCVAWAVSCLHIYDKQLIHPKKYIMSVMRFWVGRGEEEPH